MFGDIVPSSVLQKVPTAAEVEVASTSNLGEDRRPQGKLPAKGGPLGFSIQDIIIVPLHDVS
jgi:hypothetical protein